ncbi:arginase-2, mitochondrial [Octopus vulgaris]|uniref:Arginase-2, mitochondrial n=1 Tax=Octopus vulgaris TaxID=6645 RepID=A0AA36EXC9_OCTVU|nr:arginase-2, mitochondrial [Octopus vulgaris]
MSFHFSQRTFCNHLLNNFINRRTFSSFSYVIKNVLNSQHRSCVNNLLRPTRQVVQVSTRRHIHLQKIGVVGVPLNKGQDKQGVELGPKALRDNGLITSLEDLGHRINDYGNIEFENIEEDDKQPLIKNGQFLSHASKKVNL